MMAAPYELRIGRRYLRSTGNRFLSFISLISMVGVAIGVAVLIVVLSVMNGFEQELRVRILSLSSHATITAFGEGLADWQAMSVEAARNPRVVAVSPFVETEALLVPDRAAASPAPRSCAASSRIWKQRSPCCMTGSRAGPCRRCNRAPSQSFSAPSWHRNWASASAIR
jgi:lipoprotein-releasing system permease protein